MNFFVLVAGACALATGVGLAACSSAGGKAAAAPPDEGGTQGTLDAAPVDAATDSGSTPDALQDAGSSHGDDAQAADGGCPIDGGVPNDLSCTGLYADWTSKTVAADALPYTPAFVLWSDGAAKQRWIHLPPGTKIDTTDMDNWVFPVGTKIWKQFSVNGVRIETRLLWKTADQWNFVDYAWSHDGQTSATLNAGATNVNGTTYEIPTVTECATCHYGRTDMVLGFDLLGVGAPGAQGVTLADLVAKGLLTQPPPATSITVPEDSTGKAAAALGYMHVNCGSTCHNANVNADAYVTQLYMKLLASQLFPDGGAAKVTALDTYTTAVNVPATLEPGGVKYMRIAPGDAGASLVPLMALVRDPDAGAFVPMPPIVSHVADTAGVAQVQAWINGL
jgi:hypothetical protein